MFQFFSKKKNYVGTKETICVSGNSVTLLLSYCCYGNTTMHSAYVFELQVTVNYTIQIFMLHNNDIILKFCCQRQFKLFVGLPVFESSYIQINLHSLRTFINGELQRKNVRLFMGFLRHSLVNSLNTKRRQIYLKTQFVPRSKHFSSRL